MRPPQVDLIDSKKLFLPQLEVSVNRASFVSWAEDGSKADIFQRNNVGISVEFIVAQEILYGL